MSGATDLDAWPHVFVPGDPGAPVLLTLHGTGGTEQEIAALAPRLDPDASVLSPRGQVREAGMARWFRRRGEGVFDVEDVVARAGELAGFLAAARERYGLDGRPVVAVGFSNGANIALATAMLHPAVLPRVVALSGMYPFGERDEAVTLDGVQVTLVNGRQDPLAPFASVEHLVTVLRGRGAEVDQHVRAGGHGITADDLAAARGAVARLG